MAKLRSLFGSVTVVAVLALATGGTALSDDVRGTAAPKNAYTAAATAGCGRAPTLSNGTHTAGC